MRSCFKLKKNYVADIEYDENIILWLNDIFKNASNTREEKFIYPTTTQIKQLYEIQKYNIEYKNNHINLINNLCNKFNKYKNLFTTIGEPTGFFKNSEPELTPKGGFKNSMQSDSSRNQYSRIFKTSQRLEWNPEGFLKNVETTETRREHIFVFKSVDNTGTQSVFKNSEPELTPNGGFKNNFSETPSIKCDTIIEQSPKINYELTQNLKITPQPTPTSSFQNLNSPSVSSNKTIDIVDDNKEFNGIYYYTFLNCIANDFNYYPIINLMINKYNCINDIIINCIIGNNLSVYKKYINNFQNQQFTTNTINIYYFIFYLMFYYDYIDYLQYIKFNNELYNILHHSLIVYLKNSYIFRKKSFKSFSFCNEDILDSYIFKNKIKNNELINYIKFFNINLNFIILIYKNCNESFFNKVLNLNIEKLLNNLNNETQDYNYCKLFMELNLKLFNILQNSLNLKDNLNLSNKINLTNKFLNYNIHIQNIDIFLNILNLDINIIANSLLIYNTNPNVNNYIGFFNYYIKCNKILNLCYLISKKLNLTLPVVFFKKYKNNLKTFNIENFDNNYENNIDILNMLIKEINNLIN
jgi:hypothetical protein